MHEPIRSSSSTRRAKRDAEPVADLVARPVAEVAAQAAISGEVVEHDELTEQMLLLTADGEPWTDPHNRTRSSIAVPRRGYGPQGLRLNANQEAFCQAYSFNGIASGNATRAYELAYAKTDRFTASKLLRKAHIAERIKELNDEAIEEAQITAESWLIRQRRLSEMAVSQDALGVAATYEKMIGTAIGALAQTTTVKIEPAAPIDEVLGEMRRKVEASPTLERWLKEHRPDALAAIGMGGEEPAQDDDDDEHAGNGGGADEGQESAENGG